ncbi:MAG: TonB-dependent receptor, partial [Melioribacteraceae bacterium]|nr:TonB-dependent receptor [Melioribacteraceae bacterium]
MLRRLSIIIFLIPIILFSQENGTHTLSGFIYDESNGETMIGANVYIDELGVGTSSNVYGFYSITLPNGEYTVEVSFIGYEKVAKKIDFNISNSIDFFLKSELLDLEEIVVVDEKIDENVRSTDMGTKDIAPKSISKVPVLLGEKDILKTIQLLPGISSSGEGNSGFIVRGGSADQNLVILDEAPVYNPSHLLGFFSIFNSDAIKNAKIIKGVAGPEYGGRLSSVLDINMKDGSKRDYLFYGGLGLISSRLTVEGPIVKDKGSFIVSGRRTYADLFFPLFNEEQLDNSTLYFYDLKAKINYQLDHDNRLFLSAYTGRDIFSFNDEFGFDWGNTTATLRWNHILTEQIFSNTTIMYSEYNYDINVQDADRSATVSSGIRDWHLKGDLQYFYNSENTFKFGINAIYHTFNPGQITAKGNTIFNSKNIDDQYAIQGDLYFGHEWTINPLLKLNYGIRYSSFTLFGPTDVYTFDEQGNVTDTEVFESGEIVKAYNHIEPRFAGTYLLDETSSIKLGYARNTQNIHLLSNSTTSTPLDIWQPSTAIIKPQVSDIISTGYFRNFLDNKYAGSIEFYYKDMRNLIEYKNGADIFLNEFVESQLVFGKGWSYGMELFLEKKTGK